MITGIHEQAPSGALTFDPQSKYWKREYTRTLWVDTDSAHDGPVTILAGLGVFLGATYALGAGAEFDGGSFLQSIACDPDSSSGDFQRWVVRLAYGPLNPAEWPEDPTAQPPEIRGGFNQFERVADQDVNGNPIVNSAGDGFDPPAMKDDSRPVLSIGFNSLAFDLDTANNYKDAVNLNSFCGAPPGTVKVMNIGYERLFNPRIGWYWKLLYEFQMNAEGWDKVILDAGLYQLDGSNRPTPILLNGVPAQEPQLLNGAGKVVNVAAGGSASYLNFRVYKQLDFGALGLSRAEGILAGTGT